MVVPAQTVSQRLLPLATRMALNGPNRSGSAALFEVAVASACFALTLVDWLLSQECKLATAANPLHPWPSSLGNAVGTLGGPVLLKVVGCWQPDLHVFVGGQVVGSADGMGIPGCQLGHLQQ